MPKVATMGSIGALYGLLILGSLTLSNHTAPQIMAKANNVPMLVISDTLSIGVSAEIIDTNAPTKIVDFQGVLKVGCMVANIPLGNSPSLAILRNILV